MPRVTIRVTLKPGLLDTQGRAVEGALHSIGFSEATNLKIGKLIELDLPGEEESARQAAQEMCEKLLANPVMESYRIEVQPT